MLELSVGAFICATIFILNLLYSPDVVLGEEERVIRPVNSTFRELIF